MDGAPDNNSSLLPFVSSSDECPVIDVTLLLILLSELAGHRRPALPLPLNIFSLFKSENVPQLAQLHAPLLTRHQFHSYLYILSVCLLKCLILLDAKSCHKYGAFFASRVSQGTCIEGKIEGVKSMSLLHFCLDSMLSCNPYMSEG